MSKRHVGVNVPLFSLRSRQGWGIGEVTDLPAFLRWLAEGAFDRLMLLPLGTMQHGQTSPYSAMSTLAIDPIYIGLDSVREFRDAGGIDALPADARAAIDAARDGTAVDYGMVRKAKGAALSMAFDRFRRESWEQGGDRADALQSYIRREGWWLDDYALYQALSETHGYSSWREWPEGLRDRNAEALAAARQEWAVPILAHQYFQWVADAQWAAARTTARDLGVAIYGDLPFVAGTDSPEVWAHSHDFMLDVSTGVPPDAFSETGQDWGLPTYRWDAIRRAEYPWLRSRARRMAELYDGLRVDHTIGLYRTYGRPSVGDPFFIPADEETQIAQGTEVLRILGESGLDLIAEDLGSVPDFLRRSLAELGVPGCRVLRWERDWDQPGQPFIDPETFPALSAAMTGTHDTEPLAAWWGDLPIPDREALLAIPFLRQSGLTDPAATWSHELRDGLLELAYRAGSRDLFLPVQDLFGWEGRINVPGTVGPHNWTWVLPWPVDEAAMLPGPAERARFLRSLSARTGRGTAA
jgi:4-alpha-glucanotransferase